MKSLVVAEAYPWPADDGYRLRVSNLIEAFAALGPVDFVCLDGSDRRRDPAPANITVIDAPEQPERGIRDWIVPWITGRWPRRLLRRNYEAAAQHFATIDQTNYDICFVSHVDCWFPLREQLVIPTIVDYDNLEDMLTRTIRKAGPIIEPGDGLVQRIVANLRWLVASGFNLVDERRWATAQRTVHTSVDHTLVCSPLDVERLAVDNVTAIPNGYTRSFEPADHIDINDAKSPAFFFVGLLSYDPNSDAVRWFATQVLPLIRAELVDARFRVVGRGAEHVAGVAALPGVDIVGAVDSLEDELRRADVAVIPLHSGAGTRLKVVEAMANRLPMVTTAMGCEGIDVVDGVHAWIRDDAQGFAAACIEAVKDAERRRSTIEAAEQLYTDRYRWDSIQATLGALAQTVAKAP